MVEAKYTVVDTELQGTYLRYKTGLWYKRVNNCWVDYYDDDLELAYLQEIKQ